RRGEGLSANGNAEMPVLNHAPCAESASSSLEPCYLAHTPRFRLIAITEDALAPQLPCNAELEIFDIGSIAARRPTTLLGDHHATNIFRPRGDDARLIAFKQTCAWLPDQSSIRLRAHDAAA